MALLPWVEIGVALVPSRGEEVLSLPPSGGEADVLLLAVAGEAGGAPLPKGTKATLALLPVDSCAVLLDDGDITLAFSDGEAAGEAAVDIAVATAGRTQGEGLEVTLLPERLTVSSPLGVEGGETGVRGPPKELEAVPEELVVRLPPATRGSEEEEAPDGEVGGEEGFVPVVKGKLGELFPTGGLGGGLCGGLASVAAGEEEAAGAV